MATFYPKLQGNTNSKLDLFHANGTPRTTADSVFDTYKFYELSF